MKRKAILVALMMGLGLAGIRLIPCGAVRASKPALPISALVQSQSGRPVRAIQGLQSITVWIANDQGGATGFTLGVNGSEFTTRLGDPLGPPNRDIADTAAIPTSFYDVYYSNADGAFNIDGSYITVESGGSGLRLGEVWLNFGGVQPFETGNSVASFVALGDNADPGSVGNAIDNNINTFTRLGNSITQSRRRITIGFASSSVPAGPALFIDDVEVREGDSGTIQAVFRVRLTPSSSLPVTVAYATQDFTAASASDYAAGNGSLTFFSGDTQRSIAVAVRGDTLYEASEQFFVNLTNPVNAGLSKGQATCTILDNEPGSFTVCSNDVPKTAGRMGSTINIERDGVIDDVNVSCFLGDGDDTFRSLEVNLRSPSDSRVVLVGSSLRRGRQLGTTCSPSPNCVFDDQALTSVSRGSPPYVGTFKPFTALSNLARESPTGTWTLTFENPGNGETIHCWCLELGLPREGCRLEPATAIARIFFPHTVRAVLTSNGAPVSGQTVSFTVRGEQGELRLQEDNVSDVKGVATLRYYDFKPGLNFIEARATINGVLSIANAQVIWEADGLSGCCICPVEDATENSAGAEATLSAARGLRDNVLAQSPRGQKYTRLYYEFSTEAVRIMMFNPMLMLRSREIIERYKPVIRAMAGGEAVTLTQGDLDEIDGFMNAFAAKGSAGLQETIKGLCEDLRDPQMHAEFSITVTEGPKRELPAHDQLQTVQQMGGPVIYFGLGWLAIFAATGIRRKVLRRRVAPTLSVVLAVAVVASSSGQWSVISDHSSTAVSPGSGAEISKPDKGGQRLRNAIADEAKVPLGFEANQGQTDPEVKFIARAGGYNLFLSPTEAVMKLKNQKSEIKSQIEPPLLTPDVLRMKLTGANPEPKITGLDRLPATSNYFVGNDPTRWRAGVPSYARVRYEHVYPGIDMLYYGNQKNLEYDFILAPGADPGAIGLAFDGADNVEIDAAGDLVLSMPGGEIRQPRPLVYQQVDGARQTIPGRYRIRNQEVGFELGPYDASRPLIIDPVLVYSTYLGGVGDDQGTGVTVDAAGNAYVIGFTDSIDFPTTSAAQPAPGGGLQDAFVAKLDRSGTQLIYSTYIGGDGQDNGSAIAIDAAGNAYVTGYTGSTNFPVAGALQPAISGNFNAFVAKLSPTGGLLYSTHLGGSAGDFGSSIAVDSSGNIYVAGVATSPNFPVTGAIQSTPGGAADLYVAKIDPSGTRLVYSTYLGGSDNDGVTGLAVDSSGNLYLTGVTSSPNFRTANPLQSTHGGGLFDAFVAKLNPAGSQLLYSTYLGGNGEDRGFRIAVDSTGNAYVTGDTDSINFPTANALQRNKGGGVDAFVAKLNPSGTALTYSTYLGGSSIEGGTAIAVDSSGSAYVTGFTGSTNFPIVSPLQQIFGGNSFDGFAAKISPTGTALDYSTYLGGGGIDSGFGVAVDSSGNAYVMGVTGSTDFPVANPLQQAYGGGTSDLFVAKINQQGPAISNATVSGKNLIVTGSGFDQGAKILLNGQQQKTSNDAQNPTTSLIGKKVGKKIGRGQRVTLQVRNSDGTLSNEFSFTRPVQ